MSARSGGQMPISLLRSKELKKQSARFAALPAEKSTVSGSHSPCEALPWASWPKIAPEFSAAGRGADLPCAHGQTYLPTKPSNE